MTTVRLGGGCRKGEKSNAAVDAAVNGKGAGVNMWVTTRWGDKQIKQVEVDRKTETSVWVEGRRRNIKSDWDNYHETWYDAYSFLLNRATDKRDRARENLERAEEQLAVVLEMQPQTDAAVNGKDGQ
jgi:hypothetical protein